MYDKNGSYLYGGLFVAVQGTSGQITSVYTSTKTKNIGLLLIETKVPIESTLRLTPASKKAWVHSDTVVLIPKEILALGHKEIELFCKLTTSPIS